MTKINVSSPSSLVEFKKIEGSKVPATTSLVIADVFGKEHFNVIQSIQNLIETGKFGALNYQVTSYKDVQGKKRPMYVLDETFTTVLIMGFTGESALDWKLAYTKEFQRMRSIVPRTKGDPSAELNKTVNAILECSRAKRGLETDQYQYANIAKAVNKEVFGYHMNEIRQEMTPDQQTKLNQTLTQVAKQILKSI
jgi:Rha family phage regulatory protein